MAHGAVEINLASDSAWTASADGGAFQPIIVPGGGWNSDKQSAPRMRPLTRHEEPNEGALKCDPRGGARARPDLGKLNQDPQRPVVVNDHVAYRRELTIPTNWAKRAIHLEFGGVNYGAEILLDGKKVGEHDGPMMPFVVDLTGVAQPGKTYRLEVKAYHSRHYNVDGLCSVPAGFDYEYWRSMHAPGWTSKTAYGIVKYIRLTSLPLQYVRDVAVRTSVKNDTLSFEVTLANAGDKPVEVELSSALSSWKKSAWKYPTIPARTVTIPGKGEAKVVIADIHWGLGPQSWWWPNIPFREDYQAQLHLLHWALKEDGKEVAEKTQRFGFVEHAEGPYYYTVNGVRVNNFSDGTTETQLSEFDAYAELPAYKTADACCETWRRFMRIGINANRISQSTPTRLMLDTADETGFMLVAETGLRGCHNQGWHPLYSSQAVREMIAHTRNHPCVVRYSLQNEMEYNQAEWARLIDAATEMNPGRPLVMEDNNVGRGLTLKQNKFIGTRGGHAYAMTHYTDYPKPCRDIFGEGEVDWGDRLLPAFAVHARDLRLNDLAYFAPWSWLNYWPNFLEGGNHAKHGWKLNNDPDRVDDVDGWNSPIIEFVHRSLHPYLVQDLGILAENPGAPKPLGQDKIEWPYQLPTVLTGKPTERKIEVFNGGLSGNKLTLRWCAHWDKPDGLIAVPNGEIPCEIEPGFHAAKAIAFTVPKIEQDDRKLCLVLESLIDGKTVFRSEDTTLHVVARKVDPAAAFLGTDDKTRGDWQGKYGTDGYELEAKETKLPGYAKLEWKTGSLWTYDKATDDPRALAYFANPPTGKDRIAAIRYAEDIVFDLDVGQSPRRLSIYYLDYDKKTRRQQITITDALTGGKLDQREIGNFTNGRYHGWQVKGKVRVTIRKITGDNATIAAIFLDPAKK